MALVTVMWGLGVLVDGALVIPLLFSLATLLVVLFFGCALGVFYSAGGTSSLRAMGNTLGTLFFVGGGYLFCCVPLMAGGPGRDGEVILALCIPFLVVFPLMETAGLHGTVNAPELTAYVVGNIAYLVGALILAATAIGRIRPNEPLSPRPEAAPGTAGPGADRSPSAA